MPLLLPNLDDRRWADLVDEGRALIPVYGPEWTDHNAHDPGITLMELIAWIAEMDIYQLNQISDADRRKFLELVGIATRPPAPGRTILSFSLGSITTPIALPATLEFSGAAPDQASLRFRTLQAATLVPGSLDALQFRDARGFQNLTPSWLRRRAIYPLGLSPQTGMEFYLGLSTPLPVGVPASFYFSFADGRSGLDENERLAKEEEIAAKACCPPSSNNPCQKVEPHKTSVTDTPKKKTPFSHYGVRTVWEIQALAGGQAQWQTLDPAKGEVEDWTRALTLDGTVTFRVPAGMRATKLGPVSGPLYYLRCRIAAGVYDASPMLRDVAFNSVRAVQSVPSWMSFAICPNAHVVNFAAVAPKPGDLSTLRLELDQRKRITSLTFGGGKPADPTFRILEYQAPTPGAAGILSIEAVFLGFGNGMPEQSFNLSDVPVAHKDFSLYTFEEDSWNPWKLRPDFDSSSREDFHALLNSSSGTITFGDGEKGRVPPGLRKNGSSAVEKCLVFAVARTTQAATGNVPAGTITELAKSLHNRALLYDPAAVPDGWTRFKPQLASITNPLPANGGAAEETIALASGRADRMVTSSQRAVTLQDYEQLALRVPGTRVARVTAIANFHPSFPCFEAPGLITVIVLPYLPQGRPVPSPGLLRTVTAYLRRRRVIGTRVEVVGPSYVEVAVRTTAQSKKGTNKIALQQSVVNALNGFLDALRGGPDGTGWPFGRDIYRSEVMRIMDEVSGVDHILSMDLLTGDCEAQCGNVCLGPTSLVAAGDHEITVL
jgi:hypothetical protein